MSLTPENIDDYVCKSTSEQPKYLYDLAKETYQKALNPRMLSGFYQGRLLSMISKIINPTNILEIGTYTGFSALCLAEGLKKEGALETIDIKEEWKLFYDKYFEVSGFKNQIQPIIGKALEVIPTLEKKYDLVFIDADKSNYLNYLNLVIPKLNSGAVVLSDNVLWDGKVLSPKENKNDTDTVKLIEFNKALQNHPNFETLMLPVRDGITISRFKG